MLYVDGVRQCSMCQRRPAKGKGQSYCRLCHAVYMQEWRAKNRLTPEEKQLIAEHRAKKAAG